MIRSLRQALKRFTGGLRFRLTMTYVVFFTILLGFLGLFFRETISRLYDDQYKNLLNEEIGAVRGYVRIEKPKRKGRAHEINWYYDRYDPEEALIFDRLRQVYMIADAAGNVVEMSSRYRQLPLKPPEEIRSEIRNRKQSWYSVRDRSGNPYLVRTAIVMSEDDLPYYMAIARPVNEGERFLREFTWYYSWMLPLMILSSAVIGWFMAGRALIPVDELAQTAERITGSDLRVQIPPRGCRDELDRLIEAFNRMVERLDASFTQTRQFSTDVSHDLRTPLTAIRGQLEVALLAARTPEQYQEAILNALQDVERLSRTIRALLLLSQAESGQLALQKQAVNLDRVLADIVDQFQIPAEAAHLRLSVVQTEPVRIEADTTQIERLVSNLLSNAVKYTPAGGSIDVALYSDADNAYLRIADTGVGIGPDHLPYIFDRFYRVPGRHKSDSSPERGLGLGLSFVAWIAKAHGGNIDVQSAPGTGTTFTVRLPRGSPADSEGIGMQDAEAPARV